MHSELLVTKASGEQCPFSEEKLLSSLRRAGADDDQANTILQEVQQRLYDGITTRKIYRIAFSLLKNGSRHLAARYHLKQAIMELGPSGFPFERYIGELLRFEGYRVQIGRVLQGKCVSHEIDVIAENEKEYLLIECKYHNYAGVSCDVKVPLYISARYQDVVANLKPPHDKKRDSHGWVVTNTRFTEDAVKYARCSGLKAWGWDYPLGNGLKDQIDRLGLYPVTCLTSLTRVEKQKLLERDIVLCREIRDNEKVLKSIGIKPVRLTVVMNEARQLCKHLRELTPVTF